MNPLKEIRLIGLILFSLGICGLPAWAAPGAQDLMKRNEQARTLQDTRATARLVQQTSGKEAKEKSFRWMRKADSEMKNYRTLVRFLTPATVRGEGLLIAENDGGENEVQLYLPAYKKVRRVENQQQSGKFMGSEFSYSDLATPHLSDYTYRGGALVECPGAEPAGTPCHSVEAEPSSGKVSERTGYSRIINLIHSRNFMLVGAEYFGSDGKLLKRLESRQIVPAEGAPGKWIARQVTMTHVPSGNRSIIELSDIQVNSGIPDSTFTVQSLSRTD